jgi:hypothetical protein
VSLTSKLVDPLGVSGETLPRRPDLEMRDLDRREHGETLRHSVILAGCRRERHQQIPFAPVSVIHELR